MANHEIPRTAQRIETMFGVDANGDVVRVVIFEHKRQGHVHKMYYVLQYREIARRIERGSRHTRQYTGPDALARLEADIAETRDLLADSRERAAKAAA